MASLLQRLTLALRAFFNPRRGSRAVADPARLFREVEDAVHKAKLEAAKGAAEVRRLEQERDGHLRRADEYAGHAKVALEKGREDLAMAAVRREVSLRRSAEDLLPHISDLQQSSARMLASAQAMQARLDAAKTRISQVGARERLAQSQANLAGLRAELYGDCRPGMFDHLDVRLDDKESRIAAREILASDPLDLQLAELSTHGPSADERLAELRRTAQAGETAAGETAET